MNCRCSSEPVELDLDLRLFFFLFFFFSELSFLLLSLSLFLSDDLLQYKHHESIFVCVMARVYVHTFVHCVTVCMHNL